MPCDGEFKHFKCSSCDTEMKACSWSVHYAEESKISGFIAMDYIVFGDEMQSYIEEERAIEKVFLFDYFYDNNLLFLIFLYFLFTGKS